MLLCSLWLSLQGDVPVQQQAEVDFTEREKQLQLEQDGKTAKNRTKRYVPGSDACTSQHNNGCRAGKRPRCASSKLALTLTKPRRRRLFCSVRVRQCL